MKPENITIALDDGHGIDTLGKRTPQFPDGSIMKENEFNADVVERLHKKLKQKGFRVILVAPEVEDTPLATRVSRANQGNATLYLSVHANANLGTWGDWGGIETFVHPKSSEGSRIGKIIHNNIMKGTKLRDRGVKDGSHLFVIKNTKMPAVLVELGFMDNLYEAQLLRSDAYREECASELYKGICESFGIDPGTSQQPPVINKSETLKDYLTTERYNGTDVAFIKLPKGKFTVKFVYAKGKTVQQLVKEYGADFGTNFPFYNATTGEPLGDTRDQDKVISSAYGKMLKWHEFAVTKDGVPVIGQLQWKNDYDVMLQGAPLLNENGKPVYEFYAKNQEVQDDIAKSRAQRTVFSVDAEGNLLITISGGRSNGQTGWSLADASTYHLRKGALWTLNGDGGGSSVLADKNGVLTDSIGATGRTVHHAVLFFLKQEPKKETSQEPQKLTKFKDVPAKHWAEASIKKASEKGILVGVSEDAFGVGQPVTREQLAAILDRLGLLD